MGRNFADVLGPEVAARPRTRLAMYLKGCYARSVYLPISTYTQVLRGVSRRVRGVRRGQKTALPVEPWRRMFPARPIVIAKLRRGMGGVSLAELGLLATAAASTRDGTEIIEFGTFDGRTTLNLALNSDPRFQIFTLDLPPNASAKFMHAPGEQVYIEKPMPGRFFRRPPPECESACARIVQLLGDSATFDWSGHHGKAGLVFVDGSHAYDAVMSDSDIAFKLVASKGTIIWHDYGVWEGVTRALEKLEATRHLGLRHIRGTSFVIWRAGANNAGPNN